MKKIFKIPLIMSLVIIFGCFSNAFAAINQNNNGKKIAETRKSVKLLDNTAVNTSNTGDVGIDQYTKLLMHMDDNGFKDECGNTITNNGVALDISNKKFGNGSAYFYNNESLIISRDSAINFNSDFTMEMWIYLTDTMNKHIVFSQCSSNEAYRGLLLGVYQNNLLMYATSDNSSWNVFNGINMISSIPQNKWVHIAIVRNGSKWYGFLNGILSNTITNNVINITTSEFPMTIGNDPFNNSNYVVGNIDELRISNIARWTGNFTPPTSPYNTATEISLNKTTDSLIVGQTDTLTATVTPDSAANQSITWTSSDPNVATVDLAGKVTAIKSGTATITATTTDGSNLSASCVVTVAEPSNPTNDSDKAVLNITMTNGQVKQYNVTMDTINKFISWYRLRSAGSGDPFYEFDITQTSNPDIIKTDYVIFDKISSFEVDDYTK